jgi:hypothetical protein
MIIDLHLRRDRYLSIDKYSRKLRHATVVSSRGRFVSVDYEIAEDVVVSRESLLAMRDRQPSIGHEASSSEPVGIRVKGDNTTYMARFSVVYSNYKSVCGCFVGNSNTLACQLSQCGIVSVEVIRGSSELRMEANMSW